MRKCPECGYQEPLIWRNRMAKRLYTSYCRIDEFKDWYPELAEKLKNVKQDKRGNRYLYAEGVKYKLTSKGYVERIFAMLCAHPEPENPSLSEPHFEKHKARIIGYNPKVQKKLIPLIVPAKKRNEVET